MRAPVSRMGTDVRAGAGFTIIELLVAVAITAAMAAVMLAMTTNIMNSWSRASGKLSAQAQARTALDYLQRDLEAAIFRSDGNVWFAVDTIAERGGNNGPNVWQYPENPNNGKPGNPSRGDDESSWDPEQNRFGWAGVWLRFFTSDPDVNAVSYQIVRRTITSAEESTERYMLYRSKVSAENTFSAGYNIVGENFGDGTNVGGDGAGTTAGSAPEVQQPSRESLVASNVVDFGVRLFWKTRETPGDPTSQNVFMEIFPDPKQPFTQPPGNGNALLAHRSPPLPGNDPEPEDSSDFDGNYREYLEYHNENNIENITGRSVPNNVSTRIPNVAEITLRVLTDEGARLLSNYEAGRIEGNWWDIVEEHSEIFTRRVVLRNAPEGR